MSKSLNKKVDSITKSVDKRKERYDNKHAVKPRGQSGTHRLKNLHNPETENKEENIVEEKSFFGKLKSRFYNDNKQN